MHGKSPGKIALHEPVGGILLLGDVVIGSPPGALRQLAPRFADFVGFISGPASTRYFGKSPIATCVENKRTLSAEADDPPLFCFVADRALRAPQQFDVGLGARGLYLAGDVSG